MKVRIVCYEDPRLWILGKFAIKLEQHLLQLGVQVDISDKADKAADINHHIIYYGYNSQKSTIDTLMITHIDDISKKTLLKKQLEIADMGICMSNETMLKLSNLGIPRDKLCYINPAHDGNIKPKPKVIGVTSRVQPDGRKREYLIEKLADDISPLYFSFKIMGQGWENQVYKLRLNGFLVEYIDHFDYDLYTHMMPTFDYYLYMGQDEGQIGFIDALTAGVETIVTPQGYHLDALDGISYSFSTYDELLTSFKLIETSRKKLVNSVANWNWIDYTKKHVEVWEHLLSKNNDKFHAKNYSTYPDGFNTISEYADLSVERVSYFRKIMLNSDLIWKKILHTYFYRKIKNG